MNKQEAVNLLKSKGVSYLGKDESLGSTLDKFSNAPDRKVHHIGLDKITDQQSLEDAHFAFDRLASTGKANYPVGMSSCYVVGLSGDCGLSCPVLKSGDCKNEEEMGVSYCDQCSEMVTHDAVKAGDYSFCSEKCRDC